MQVGDLVRWDDGEGGYELGIVTSFDAYEEYLGVKVYFFDDGFVSEMTKENLEVINENR